MGKRSACKDPSLWHGVVLAWMRRRHRGATCPVNFGARFLPNLDTYIALAESDHAEAWRFASAIVAFFYWRTKAQRSVDPRAVAYIDAALPRYCKDKRRDIGKALLLVKRKNRGNPGRVATGKRRLTPLGFLEVGIEVLAAMANGATRSDALEAAAARWKISTRTAEGALAAAKAEKRDARQSGERITSFADWLKK